MKSLRRRALHTTPFHTLFAPPGTARARRLFGNAIFTPMTLTTYLLYVAAIALLILTPGT